MSPATAASAATSTEPRFDGSPRRSDASGRRHGAPPTHPEDDDDQGVLRAVLTNERGAWERFEARFGRLIERAVGRVTRRFSRVVSSDDASDILGTLYVQLLSHDKIKLRSFDPERGHKLSSWIAMLATRAAYDFLRKRRRDPRSADVEDVCDIGSDAADPFEQCARRERARLVSSIAERFTEKDREFLALYYAEELEPEQIARRMGIHVKTVYTKKHKIQTRLEHLLGGDSLAA